MGTGKKRVTNGKQGALTRIPAAVGACLGPLWVPDRVLEADLRYLRDRENTATDVQGGQFVPPPVILGTFQGARLCLVTRFLPTPQ
jgi:hypothetical protein